MQKENATPAPLRCAAPQSADAALASALTASTGMASALLDDTGALRSCSPAVASVFGLEHAPPLGSSGTDLLPPDTRAAFAGFAARVLAEGGADTLLIHMGEGAARRTVSATLLPVPGRVPGGPALALLARDITTEHEETEKLRRGTLEVIRLNSDLRRETVAKQIAVQSLEELSSRLRSVLEAASRVAIVSFSRSGVIMMFNPGAANLLGYAPEEMEGVATPLTFLDEAEVEARGQTLGEAEGGLYAGVGVLAALARSGRKEQGEWTLLRKDGGRFAAEVALSCIEGPHGVEGYLLVGVDISGRKKAEEATREREARLRAILDGAGDGILTVDSTRNVESVNTAALKLFGRTEAEMIGMPLEKLVPGALKAVPKRPGATRELHGLRGDGAAFPVEITVSTVEAPARRLHTCIVRDITARRKAEEAQQAFTSQLSRQKAEMDRDLRAAAEIQRSLLPRQLTPDPRYTARWLFEPSAAIGGDIFNIIPLEGGRVAAYILDVSGHGVPSALVAAAAAQELQARVGLRHGTGHEPPPEDVLTALDQEFPLERFDRYFSLVYLTLDPSAGEMAYCNGGHPPPLLLRRGGQVEELDAGGTVVGLGGLLPYERGDVRLAPGDMLALYTDGITELEDERGRPYGKERLRRTLCGARGADEALAALREDIRAHTGKGGPQDDMTLLLLELAPQHGAEHFGEEPE